MHYYETYLEPEAAVSRLSEALGLTSSLMHFEIEDVSGHQNFLGKARLTALEESPTYTGSATITYGRVEWGSILVKNNPNAVSSGYNAETNTHRIHLSVDEPIPVDNSIHMAMFLKKHIFSQLGVASTLSTTSDIRESTPTKYSITIGFAGSLLFYGLVDITITYNEGS